MASLIQTLQHTLQSKDPLLALETKAHPPQGSAAVLCA